MFKKQRYMPIIVGVLVISVVILAVLLINRNNHCLEGLTKSDKKMATQSSPVYTGVVDNIKIRDDGIIIVHSHGIEQQYFFMWSNESILSVIKTGDIVTIDTPTVTSLRGYLTFEGKVGDKSNSDGFSAVLYNSQGIPNIDGSLNNISAPFKKILDPGTKFQAVFTRLN